MRKYKGISVKLPVDRFLELLRAEEQIEEMATWFQNESAVLLLSDFEKITGISVLEKDDDGNSRV